MYEQLQVRTRTEAVAKFLQEVGQKLCASNGPAPNADKIIMRKSLLAVLFVFLCSVVAQADLDGLRDDLRSNRVATVKVTFIPHGLETIIAIRPRDVGKYAQMTLTTNLTSDMKADLIKALGSKPVVPDEIPPDVHWAVSFIDNLGVEIHTVYSGREYINTANVHAEVDGDHVLMDLALVKWLEKYFVPDADRR